MMTARLVAPIVLGLSLASLLAGGAGATQVAHAASGCSIPSHGEHLGPTYLTQLNVSGTSCTTGVKVVKAYHACQLKNGGVKAECHVAVDGFRCAEKRGPAIPTEFFSTVSCQDRSARVNYKYSQFT
jgi:hypothetical protein